MYEKHKGRYHVTQIPDGIPENLSSTQKETIDVVLDFYGDKSSHWLSSLTHMEGPWKKARKGLPPRLRGKNVITLESMVEYYEGIAKNEEISVDG